MKGFMALDVYKRAFDGFLKDYLSLAEGAEIIVRQLKKTPKPESRSKIIAELRNLERRRLKLLDLLDGLAKTT
jgi:hypothetical protein